MADTTHPIAEQLATLAQSDPALAAEVESWRCPVDAPIGFDYGADEGTHLIGRQPCGGRATQVTYECSATKEVLTEYGWQQVHHGADPKFAERTTAPAAYDLTFGCEHGHETYIRTQSV